MSRKPPTMADANIESAVLRLILLLDRDVEKTMEAVARIIEPVAPSVRLTIHER